MRARALRRRRPQPRGLERAACVGRRHTSPTPPPPAPPPPPPRSFNSLFCGLGYFAAFSPPALAPVVVVVCLLCTLVESLPLNALVDDNLSVPAAAVGVALLLLPLAAAATAGGYAGAAAGAASAAAAAAAASSASTAAAAAAAAAAPAAARGVPLLALAQVAAR